MATVEVYYAQGNRRSKTIADAAFVGLRCVGDTPRLMDSKDYRGVRADYAVFYGLACGLDRIFEEYSKQASAIYVDLGFWHRRLNSRYDGYHKLSVNALNPTAYFMQRKHCPKRFKALGLTVAPWRKNEEGGILLAGMSEKAALARGLAAHAWERQALRTLQENTERQVTYRPKPSCRRSYPLKGAGFDKGTPLPKVLPEYHAVVTRQSNTAIDALLAGVPVFCEQGVASALGCDDLSLIEKPYYPDNRQEWAESVAWCQFTTAEIATALPWRHFKEEGLIP